MLSSALLCLGLLAVSAPGSPDTADKSVRDLGPEAALAPTAPAGAKDVDCSAIAPIGCGDTVTGLIDGSVDCALGDGTFLDRYRLAALAGQRLTIDVRSMDFNAFLFVTDATGSILDQADGGGAGTDARLLFDVPADGDYLLVPNNLQPGIEGAYSMTLACEGGPDPDPPTGLAGPGEGVFRLAAGGAHSCVLNRDVALACFGANRFGQLGTGNTESQLSPRFAPLGEQIIAAGINDIATGGVHSCLLTNDGGVHCWGGNSNGQLGVPEATRSLASPPAAPILGNVLSLDVGALHSCAVTTAGAVFCWGHNHEGQLGDGTTADSAVPVQVSGLANVQDVFLGGFHSCALAANGDVHCWGSNDFGQAGDPGLEDVLTPVRVTGLDGPVRSLAAGFTHSCALLTDGSVQCWGGVELLAPKAIGGFADIVELASGGYHVCGLTSAGAVRCAGLNDFGQLGNGDLAPSMTAVSVLGLDSGVLTLDAGGSHSCAVTGDDRLVCWGDDRRRQLGDQDADFLIDARRKHLTERRRHGS